MPKIEFLEYLFLINSFGKFIFKSDQTKDESIPINRTQEKTLMHIANCGPVPMKNVSARFGLEKGSFTQDALYPQSPQPSGPADDSIGNHASGQGYGRPRQ